MEFFLMNFTGQFHPGLTVKRACIDIPYGLG